SVLCWSILVCILYLMFVFFSSRRRHTRFKCDWSSDVCSSDLIWGTVVVDAVIDEHGNVVQARVVSGHPLLMDAALKAVLLWKYETEERRVGKECGGGWWRER